MAVNRGFCPGLPLTSWWEVAVSCRPRWGGPGGLSVLPAPGRCDSAQDKQSVTSKAGIGVLSQEGGVLYSPEDGREVLSSIA